MEIIALANQKGGVAKTTSTYNLACVAAEAGKRVLMVDLDPQASLTILCGMMPGSPEHSVCDLFMGGCDPFQCGYEVEKAGMECLYLIPSDILLAETEQAVTGRTAREKLLKKQLTKFRDDFDYIFIDCPPQLGILTTNALCAADRVLIPTKAEYLSYRGLRSLLRTIETVREEFNPDLEVCGYLVTMYERIVNDQRDILELLEKDGTVIATVKKSADSYRSVLEGIPVVLSQPRSEVAAAYREAAEKLGIGKKE